MYIYPKPKYVKYIDKDFEVKKEMYLFYDESYDNVDGLKFISELWHNFSDSESNLILKETSLLKNTVLISSDENISLQNSESNEWEYEIAISPEKAVLTYESSEGLIHALVTLLQEIESEDENHFIVCGEIKDSPSVSFRGIHLCVFPETTLDFLRKTVRLAGFLKYSHIILEFWGMLKYDVMESLSWDFAYTKDEIRPIIKDANALGMKVIPMFNHLGHASQSRAIHGRHVVLDQDPSKYYLFEPDGWTWCISNPETKELLRKIRKELIELCGNSGYFHIGCDEAQSLATCRKCRRQDKTELFTKYLSEIQEELSSDSIRCIMWGDMFLKSGDYPEKYVSLGDEKTSKAIENISREFVIADWQYEVLETPVVSADYFKSKGFDVLLSPFFINKNIETLGESSKEHFGYLATTWHLLHEKYSMVINGAYMSWCGEMNSLKSRLSSVANILRKIAPSWGNFEKAGWHEKEESAVEIY